MYRYVKLRFIYRKPNLTILVKRQEMHEENRVAQINLIKHPCRQKKILYGILIEQIWRL